MPRAFISIEKAGSALLALFSPAMPRREAEGVEARNAVEEAKRWRACQHVTAHRHRRRLRAANVASCRREMAGKAAGEIIGGENAREMRPGIGGGACPGASAGTGASIIEIFGGLAGEASVLATPPRLPTYASISSSARGAWRRGALGMKIKLRVVVTAAMYENVNENARRRTAASNKVEHVLARKREIVIAQVIVSHRGASGVRAS